MNISCRRIAVVVAALALPGFMARADLVMVQEVSGGAGMEGMEGKIVSHFKGDKARVDVGDKVSSILEGSTGKVTSLMHEQKMVMTMDGGQMQAIHQQMRQAMGKESDAVTSGPAELKPTGNKETISGFEAEEFTLEQGGETTRLWLARDHPNKDAILGQLAAFQKNDAFKFAGAPNSYDMAELPGIPVRVVSNAGGTQTTMTVLSIEEKDLDDSLFEIPEGYNSFQMPNMGDLLKKLPKGR